MVLYNAAQTSKAHSNELGSNAGHRCRNVKKIDELANERGWKRAKIMIGPETFFNAKTCKNLRRGSPLLWS